MAGGEFLGGLLGAGSDLLGGLINQQRQENINPQNIQEQEYFANNGISMKVADAKRAGINPLAALGASTSSFSNVVGSDAAGSGIAHAGQDIGRAMKAAMSPDDQAFVDASHSLQLQNAQLQNDWLTQQIVASKARMVNQPGNGAPTPTSAMATTMNGQAVPGTSGQNFPLSTVKPDKVTATETPGVAGGVGADVAYSMSPMGWMVPRIPSDQSTSQFNVGEQIGNFVRRQVMFALGHGGRGYRVRHRRNDDSDVEC